jgi:hypothetical protein
MVVGKGGKCYQKSMDRNIVKNEKEYPLRWEF